jgi:hypothetical protein
MRTGRLLAPLELHAQTQKQLQSILDSRSLPHALVRRAKGILLAADGWLNHPIARSWVGTSGAARRPTRPRPGRAVPASFRP